MTWWAFGCVHHVPRRVASQAGGTPHGDRAALRLSCRREMPRSGAGVADPLRVSEPPRRHRAVAREPSPGCRGEDSPPAQLPTWYFVLYFGWTRDFMPKIVFVRASERQEYRQCVPEEQHSRTNAVQDREGVSASAAVARARSHDHGREDARPAPLEEGGRLPSPGAGGECVLSVQIDSRGSASRPVPRRASGRVRGRV